MNKIAGQMKAIDAVTNLMNETPEQTAERRKLNEERREHNSLIAKLDNNDIYRDKERDDDLSEKESKNVFCGNKPERDIDFL